MKQNHQNKNKRYQTVLLFLLHLLQCLCSNALISLMVSSWRLTIYYGPHLPNMNHEHRCLVGPHISQKNFPLYYLSLSLPRVVTGWVGFRVQRPTVATFMCLCHTQHVWEKQFRCSIMSQVGFGLDWINGLNSKYGVNLDLTHFLIRPEMSNWIQPENRNGQMANLNP